MDRPPSRKLLAAALLLGLVLRVAFVLALERERIYFSDTIRYIQAAESLLAGEGFGLEYRRAPLYPVFLAGLLAIFPDYLMVVQLIEVLLGCLTVWLTYRIGVTVWGSGVGLMGAALVATHPYLAALSGFLYPEVLFTTLLAATTLVVLRVRGPGACLAAGLMAGAAALTRASGLVLLPSLALWLLLAGPGPGPRRLASAAGFVGGMAALLFPWFLRNADAYEAVSLVDARTDIFVPYLYEGRFMPGVEAERKAAQVGGRGEDRGGLAAQIARAPGAYAAYVGSQFANFWSLRPDRFATSSRDKRERAAARDARMVVEDHPVENVDRYGGLLAALLLPYYLAALAGLWFSRARLRGASLLLLLVLGTALGYSLVFARVRYRLPVEPFIALFAAAGMLGMMDLVGRRGRPRPAPDRAQPRASRRETIRS